MDNTNLSTANQWAVMIIETRLRSTVAQLIDERARTVMPDMFNEEIRAILWAYDEIRGMHR